MLLHIQYVETPAESRGLGHGLGSLQKRPIKKLQRINGGDGTLSDLSAAFGNFQRTLALGEIHGDGTAAT